MAHGGKRPGAGRPLGARDKLTIEQKGTISELAKGYITDALRVLSSIMKDSDATPTARVAAANALLDRACGKPVQAIEARVTRVAANELGDDELAAIAAGSGDGTAEAQENPPVTH